MPCRHDLGSAASLVTKKHPDNNNARGVISRGYYEFLCIRENWSRGLHLKLAPIYMRTRIVQSQTRKAIDPFLRFLQHATNFKEVSVRS